MLHVADDEIAARADRRSRLADEHSDLGRAVAVSKGRAPVVPEHETGEARVRICLRHAHGTGKHGQRAEKVSGGVHANRLRTAEVDQITVPGNAAVK